MDYLILSILLTNIYNLIYKSKENKVILRLPNYQLAYLHKYLTDYLFLMEFFNQQKKFLMILQIRQVKL